MNWQTILYNAIVLKRVGYLSDKLYLFDYSDANNIKLHIADDSFHPHILILAREHYRESIEIYQIDDKRELKKVLHLAAESVQENSDHKFWKILEGADNGRQVNLWQPKY